MTSESDISELVETQYAASSAVQGEDRRGAAVIFHQSSHLVEGPFCSAMLRVASCSAQPHEILGEKLNI